MATLFLLALTLAITAQGAVILTGIIDGPYTGGHPKAVELYVSGTEELTDWSIVRYANGETTISDTTTLSGIFTNEFVYVIFTGGDDEFETIWGNEGDFANVFTGPAPNHNGDDAVALLNASSELVDVYGQIGVDGTGTAWECLDSYAYRIDDTGPETTFNVTNWTVGAVDLLDGQADPVTIASLVPFGTYTNSNDPNIVDPNDPNIPDATYTYDWEDGFGNAVYTYGNVYKTENTTEQVHGGSRAVKVIHYPIESSAKVMLAWVKNLQTGDTVTAKVWAYDDGIIGYQATRLVADYTSSDDITDFYGYVDGTGTSTLGLGWEQLEYTWTVNTLGGTQDGILVAAQMFSDYTSTSENFYYDDLEITVPGYAEVVLPSVIDPNEYDTHTYGWENFDPFDPAFRETVLLGTYNSIQAGLEITEVLSGTKSLSISDDSASSIGEGHVAWIKNLVPGDYIDVSCFAKSYAGLTGSKGVRLWAHYTYDNGDITSYAGDAYGFNGYSNADSWSELAKRWAFPDTVYTDSDNVQHIPNGMVIEVRTFSAAGEGGYVDDLNITVPSAATVEFPSMTGDAICVGGLPQWDFNHDCIFNLQDIVQLFDDWLTCNLQPQDDCSL